MLSAEKKGVDAARQAGLPAGPSSGRDAVRLARKPKGGLLATQKNSRRLASQLSMGFEKVMMETRACMTTFRTRP